MIIALWITGVADLVLTAWGLQLGVIEEANPIMAWLFGISIPGALLLAVVIMTAALLCLHVARNRVTWVDFALRGLLAIRFSVLALHMIWIVDQGLPS